MEENKMKYSIKDLTKEQRATAEENGIKYNTLANRLFDGWEIERAITEKLNRKGGRTDKKVKQEDGKDVSDSWFAGPGQMVKCSVEGCTHSGYVITKTHCRNEHGMEREEVKKKFGMPQVLQMNLNQVRKEYSSFVVTH